MNAYNKLWTKTAFKNVPGIGETDGQGDAAVAHVKLFSIRSDERWYILEYDKETGRAFCFYTNLGEGSYGYSIINEVTPGDWEGEDMQSQNNQNRFVPPFERDSCFTKTTVERIKAKLGGIAV